MARGYSRKDPVYTLKLEGKFVGTISCPWMCRIPGRRRKYEPCGEPASLVAFQDPFGLRAYCGEGHVSVLSKRSIPGVQLPLKGPTD